MFDRLCSKPNKKVSVRPNFSIFGLFLFEKYSAFLSVQIAPRETFRKSREAVEAFEAIEAFEAVEAVETIEAVEAIRHQLKALHM